MHRIASALVGVYELGRLGVISRFRFRGDYWTWRRHTAFGRGMPASRRELVGAVLRYGAWIGRMRRLG